MSSREGPISITSKEQFNSLLRSSRIVVADFYADWCGPCKQISPVFAELSQKLSIDSFLTFVKVNNDNHSDLAQQYKVTGLPTFLVFRQGKLDDRVQGANVTQLQSVLDKLANDISSNGAGSSSGSGGNWKGAEVPKGYSDVTDQVDLRGCELLNADEDAGPVKVLFDNSKPKGLDEEKNPSKDCVQSGADDQLLLYIPFLSTIKLHTLQITSLPPKGDDDAPARPGVVHLYINRPQNMDFSEADDTDPAQVIELGPDDWNPNGTANIPLRFVKFQKTTTLIVYVQKGDGEAETVRVDRLKLIGEAGPKREMGKLKKVGEEEE